MVPRCTKQRSGDPRAGRATPTSLDSLSLTSCSDCSGGSGGTEAQVGSEAPSRRALSQSVAPASGLPLPSLGFQKLRKAQSRGDGTQCSLSFVSSALAGTTHSRQEKRHFISAAAFPAKFARGNRLVGHPPPKKKKISRILHSPVSVCSQQENRAPL